ncbi:lipopolysaccharide kinase InaA family protein [Thiolapillus sp.]|uniref:lipopolysaccharide kinase InaA family protein n=1 Tax=Thiolapillus sp. TaxID=2017437 RepID=UPI0025EDC9FC
MSRQDWEYRREIVLPFSLELADAPTLVCEEILRLLPGRRLVCRAVQEGQPVLVKLFMGKDARRAAREDAAGIRAMMAADIDTPSRRLESRVKGKGYPVLLFDFIPAAVSFRQRWTEAGEARRVELLQALLELVAQQHQAGLRQRDFHLNNFILDADDHLYAIDGGDFIVGNQPLAQKEAIANLVVLFGHLPLQALRKHPQVLESYFNRRGQEVSEGLIRRISLKSDAFRYRRARRISRKSFRNCSEFMLRRNGGLRICQRRDFSPVELDGWIRSTGLAPRVEETILKPGNSQTVWATSIGGRDVVVKRYNLKTPLHALRRIFTRSRASKSWENAHRLRAYHIPTPEPLAMIEERRFGLRQRAWLITAKARGIGAKSYIPDHSDEPTLERLASVVRAFGENGLVHGDMKATNFMMTGESVEVIDLDSMFRPLTRPVLRARVAKDRRRFLKNWPDAGLRERFARLLGQGFG